MEVHVEFMLVEIIGEVAVREVGFFGKSYAI